MSRDVLRGISLAMVRVTVPTAAGTGAVHPDIDSFRAAARRSLIFVSFSLNPAAGDFPQQIGVHAASMSDAVLLQRDILGTALQNQPVGGSNLTYGFCQH